MLDSFLSKTRNWIPAPIFKVGNPIYHWILAFASACIYRFPSRHIKVIAITGTKGKSSTVEIINAIFEQAGYKTALTNTIRFKIGDTSKPNLYKMSMPGRGFMQRFIRNAVKAKCDYAIIEMTSQGSITYRHLFIDMDVFLFTNLSPEHIEAHGSYENYAQAKLSIARELGKSKKLNRILIVNADDKEAERFLACKADKKVTYSINNAEPYEIKEEGLTFTLKNSDKKPTTITSPLSGMINLYNILAAVTVAQSQGISTEIISQAISKFRDIPGRVEQVEAGQSFKVIVDYAHTPDSLEKVYKVFRPDPHAPRKEQKIIGILGGTGGGRDTWKRGEMGRIAELYCDEIILTDEDPYDEDPRKIVDDVAAGITQKKPDIIMDRRLAIREAISRAQPHDIIVITGKGTDPYIMGPHGAKTPWSDARVAREEIEARLEIRN
jgi:UDP-N-acetylmuramyl-tripeptide synthetase